MGARSRHGQLWPAVARASVRASPRWRIGMLTLVAAWQAVAWLGGLTPRVSAPSRQPPSSPEACRSWVSLQPREVQRPSAAGSRCSHAAGCKGRRRTRAVAAFASRAPKRTMKVEDSAPEAMAALQPIDGRGHFDFLPLRPAQALLAMFLLLAPVAMPQRAAAAIEEGGSLIANALELLKFFREEEKEVQKEEQEIEQEIKRAGFGKGLSREAQLLNLDAVLKAEEQAIKDVERDLTKPGAAGKAAFEADTARLESLEAMEGKLRFNPEENQLLGTLEGLLPK